MSGGVNEAVRKACEVIANHRQNHKGPLVLYDNDLSELNGIYHVAVYMNPETEAYVSKQTDKAIARKAAAMEAEIS